MRREPLFYILRKCGKEREKLWQRGYLYVVNTDENESMRVSEEELYNLTGHQFDYIENLPDEKSETLVKDLVQRFAAYGATTGTEEMDEGKISYAFLTQEIARKYFCTKTADP